MNSYDPNHFLSLVSGLPSPEREQQQVCMLQVFVDDSSVTSKPVGVLGGLVSTVDRWLSFSNEWADVCRAEPAIGYMKMSHAKAGEGEFSRIEREERERKISALWQVAQRHAMFGFAVSVDLVQYERHLGTLLPSALYDPYQMLVVEFANRLLTLLRANDPKKRPIRFVFDNQQGKEANVMARWSIFRGLLDDEEKAIFPSAPDFRDDKEALPLQAADMLAWWIRTYRASVVNGKPLEKLPWVGAADKFYIIEHELHEKWAEALSEKTFESALDQAMARGKKLAASLGPSGIGVSVSLFGGAPPELLQRTINRAKKAARKEKAERKAKIPRTVK